MNKGNDRFIVRLFNTYEPVTTLYRDLIPCFIKQGWRVEVVISKAQYRTGRDRTQWLQPGVQVYETPNFGLQGDNRFSKLVILLAYIFFAAVHTLVSERVDRNLFLTQPPLFFSWGIVLKKIRRQPYFITLMDLYPDVAVRDQMLQADGIVTRMLRFISRQGLRRADGVIVIGRCMAERLGTIGVEEQNVHFIPNWANETAVVPIAPRQNPFRLAQGWQDKFVVMYSGNIGTSHYFDDILKVILKLRDQSDINFVFIGNGRRQGEIESFYKKHRLDNIKLLPFQDQGKLAESLSAGDLHFVSLRPGFEGLVVPSKSYGIMAAGRPILYQGAEEGEIARMIRENKIGEVVPIGKVDRLAEVILNYSYDRDRAYTEGGRARQLIDTVYSSKQACRRYTEVLSR